MIESITVIGGRGKDGEPEPVDRIDLRMGNVASIVGPTGSGKTTFINDIEMFADADTPSLRRVLINGQRPPHEYRHDPSKNPIALITQHTTFLSDLPVGEFLEAHATVRAARPSLREICTAGAAMASAMRRQQSRRSGPGRGTRRSAGSAISSALR